MSYLVFLANDGKVELPGVSVQIGVPGYPVVGGITDSRGRLILMHPAPIESRGIYKAEKSGYPTLTGPMATMERVVDGCIVLTHFIKYVPKRSCCFGGGW